MLRSISLQFQPPANQPFCLYNTCIGDRRKRTVIFRHLNQGKINISAKIKKNLKVKKNNKIKNNLSGTLFWKKLT